MTPTLARRNRPRASQLVVESPVSAAPSPKLDIFAPQKRGLENQGAWECPPLKGTDPSKSSREDLESHVQPFDHKKQSRVGRRLTATREPGCEVSSGLVRVR